MKQLTTTLFAAALVLAPTILLGDPAVEKSPEAAEKTEEKKADQEITIICNDTMKFDKTEIQVTSGKIIKLIVKNTGKMPKAAMGHNLVILKKDVNLATWAGKAMLARATDFIPADEESKKAILIHTKLLGPGESDTIIFTAPAAGTYEFLCSFPGHYSLMKGKLIVK